ncbi:hypothetical protein AB205_0000470 [Aquarana catesbeiana]|uniref:Death domain-containing protein n=1 Tax=Aquarana catesbeiana TaxID=8400 RepID=A0A2G9NC33_AQUCT|nr:hypothetical protein AB205_0000470 [Aquarana catesbeiana]
MLIFLVHLQDDEETESTETSILKSHLVNDEPVLASPDLLSEVCEMKQDLIKMSAILTIDATQKPGTLKAKDFEKSEEDPGEPFEIVEKVKEDLEKVNEILRTGTYTREESLHDGAHSSKSHKKDEEWVILRDDEIEEAKLNALLEDAEIPCIEFKIDRGHKPRVKSDMNEMVNYLTTDLNSYSADSAAIPGTETEKKEQRKLPLEIKKPVRRKLKERQREELQGASDRASLTKFSSEESLDDETGLTPTVVPSVKEVSPVIEETPIGSIKDKVKALQKRVEEEQKGVTSTSNFEEDQERIERRLAYVADHLGFSWTELARELDFTEEQIHQIRVENPNSLQDQSHALLKYWLDRDGKHATDANLNQCLTKINRMDIVHLMETSMNEPMRCHANRTYADIEQTITLDHSEGK